MIGRRVIIATARIRGLDEVDEIGEEDWRVALAFAPDTPEEAVKAALLARLQAEMASWGPPRFHDLTMAGDMGFDDPGRVCWQMECVPVIGRPGLLARLRRWFGGAPC